MDIKEATSTESQLSQPSMDLALRRPISSRPSVILSCQEGVLVCAELLARHLFWRNPWLQNACRRSWRTKKPSQCIARRDELRDYLQEIGVTPGSLVMAHTSVSNLHFIRNGSDSDPSTYMESAKLLIDELLDRISESGTLLMPTNVQYQIDDNYRTAAERAASVLTYDPRRTPSVVGLANEYFRRRKDVVRSLHPYNPLAGRGPLVEELFRNNLNGQEPLPHGVDSAYYRFCMRDGLVLGLGVPLWHSMTVIHVAEEVRDADWPIRNFFEKRRYRIRINDTEDIYTVRQRRSEYGILSNCNRKLRRDLLREGILHEGHVGDMIVDWARAKDVFDYMMAMNTGSSYPYYGAGLVQWRCS